MAKLGRRKPAAGRAFAWIRNSIAAVVIVIALLLGLLRFGFPAIEDHPGEVEQWVGDLLHRPVRIDSLRAYWRGWSPELELHGLKMHRSGDVSAGAEPAITFDKVRIRLDPLASIKARRPLARTLTIMGASLTVKRFKDGSIHVAGMRPTQDAAGSQARDDIAGWLLNEGNLVFDATTVHWIDARRSGAPILLTSTRVELTNHGDSHRLSGTFRLPGISAERIHFALDASGDLSTAAWSGRSTISASGIRAAQLASLFKSAGDWVAGGKSDLSIWAQWEDANMQGARVLIRADGLRLSDALGGLRLHGGTAEVQMGRVEHGWSADLIISDFHTSKGRWRATRGTLDYIVEPAGKSPRLVGQLDHARLADLASLLQPWLKRIGFANAAVETYRPSAELSNLHFSMGLGSGAPEPLRLSADFDQLSAFVGPDFPGLSGYSGSIQIDGDAGVVRFNGGNMDVALNGVFGGRFMLETRGGRVAWQKQADVFRFDVYDVAVAAPGIDARVSGFTRLDGNAAGPLLNLVVNLKSDDVVELKRYIPDGILKPKLSEWLHRAVRGGRLTDGKILLHGRAADFPFDNKDGILEARLVFEDGQLDYGRQWPGINAVKGELSFRGRQLRARLQEGRIFNSRIEQASVTIDGIGQGVPVVKIRGSGSGDAADGLKFLRQSPLSTRLSRPMRDLAAAGEVELELAVDFPLNKVGIQVDGLVKFNRNRLDLPNLKSGLQRVRGTLSFDRKGADAQDIAAVYLGRPVMLSVATRPEPPHDVRVQISGRADGEFVAKHLSNSGLIIGPALWPQRLKGETEWLATIEVPAATRGNSKRPTVHLESSLDGLEIDLPYPAGKTATSARGLEVVMRSRDGKRKEVHLRYGNEAHAALELESEKGRQEIRRGSIQLGGAEARLPAAKGIEVHGNLSELPVGDWVDTWKTAFAPEGAERGSQGRLRSLSLDVSRLLLLGSRFDQVGIRASRNQDGSWNTRFEGPALQGTVRLLDAGGEKTLLASFERIDYRSMPGEGGAAAVSDPREFPAIRMMSESFRYNGRDLGLVQLSATPTAAGLNFGDISLDSPELEARANGYWHQQDGSHRSEFSISVHGRSLGGFLETMGFEGSNISDGATDVFVNARWPASPMEFDLRRLDGALHFRSTSGRLLGIKRGVTQRIFGLLSVTTLPQRLILDFTDVFEEGVSYDLIEGSFNLENGQAYTNNLTMETDTARVEVAGRTGLVSEDYDQVMTVTPKLTSSLPLAPLWIAEKAFNRELFGRAFAAQYTITGSWTDPKVEPIQAETNVEERG